MKWSRFNRWAFVKLCTHSMVCFSLYHICNVPLTLFSKRIIINNNETILNFYSNIATSEGSIPMAEGEELHVIELDQGDGWTRVRRITDASGWEEGFVPTSYIESTLYA